MPTCPSGHDSGSTDFCDVCGIRMDGPAPAAPVPSPAEAVPGPAAAAVPGEPCPQCGTSRTGQFCEVCGFNFASPPAAAGDGQAAPGSGSGSGDGTAGPGSPGSGSAGDATPGPAVVAGSAGDVGSGAAPAAAAAPDAGAVPGAVPAPGAAAGWSAVVTADRAYYDSVIAAAGPDASSIEFPGYCPERRFRLVGSEMRIGRRSVNRGLQPEIDLTGPPADTGVSHLHAVLIADPDGGWLVVDPGSANGTKLNEQDLSTGMRTHLHDGDQICLGAWTKLTIVAG